MNLEKLNKLPKAQAKTEFLRCCGAKNWAEAMTEARPFKNVEAIKSISENIWQKLASEDWLEAFSAHPKIGDTKESSKHFSSTKEWASAEQKSVASAELNVIADLANGNRAYEEKFGFIFIVCAMGKSAEEMLALLSERLGNSKEQELRNAAREQSKITRLRLEKLLS